MMGKRMWSIAGTLFALQLSGTAALASPMQDDTDKKKESPRKAEASVTIEVTAEPVQADEEKDAKESDEGAGEAATEKELRRFQVWVDDSGRVSETKLPKHWLGIQLKPIEGELAAYLGKSEGIFVESVYPDSPAVAAKLQRGDVIVAIGDQQLPDPQALISIMRELEDGDSPKPLELKILRAGESLTIEITPAVRPEGSNPAAKESVWTFSLDGKSPEEIEKLLSELQPAADGIRMFRFGAPATLLPQLNANVQQPQTQQSQTQRIESNQQNVRIEQSVNGKKVEIRILREGGKPAKITINREGKVEEFAEQDLEQMPEDVRNTVKETLKRFSATKDGRRIEIRPVQKSSEPSDGEKNPDGQQFDENIIIVRPNIGEFMNQDLAEKYRAMAQEMADRAQQSAQWARNAAAMPAEIQELKAQVEALRAEVKELRSQLKEQK